MAGRLIRKFLIFMNINSKPLLPKANKVIIKTSVKDKIAKKRFYMFALNVTVFTDY